MLRGAAARLIRLLTAALVSMALPAAASDQAAQVFAAASPSVYSIFAERDGRTMFGSGVVVGSGRIVTNFHVIDGADRIRVKHGSEESEAVLEIGDKAHDIALLQAPRIGGPSAAIGNSGEVRIGQTVYAIGSPRGLELSLSEGLISSLRQTPDGNTLQTTAPISPGSSGGGLFDVNGRLIGFTTAQVINGQNLNFAVPVEWLRFVGITVQATAAVAQPLAPATTAAQPATLEVASEPAPQAATAAVSTPADAVRSPNFYIATAMILLLVIGAKPAIGWLTDYLSSDNVPATASSPRVRAAALPTADRLAPFRVQPREEVKSGQRDADAWLQALEESGGDESRAMVAYIEMRARALHRADMDRRWEEAKAGGLIQRQPSGK